ncbi:MAG: hypothetical protein U1A22_05650 [Xanthomonadaceae bacterium]|nr:hypothetical protein [Xanthomonadaceae bacterium]
MQHEISRLPAWLSSPDRLLAIALLSVSLLAGCAAEEAHTGGGGSALAAMPTALSNNAVAQAEVQGAPRFYSFMGLGAGKTWLDIGRQAFEYDVSANRWSELPPVPVAEGRLASVAATVDNQIYLFGGYTVAPDGHEVSTPEVLRFDPRSRSYTAVAAMPTPVDDSVALVWRERWIYLVSGWHMDANVALVQVYDTQTDRWEQATAFPGAPVFGHAGALLGDTLVVCDGVRLDVIDDKRSFSASNQCWRGDIDPTLPTRIDWRQLPPHPGAPRYRMGAAADPAHNRLVFAGGSENPYNFDGVGYNGAPAPASRRVQAYSLDREAWLELPPLPEASMDHRGLLHHDGRFFLLGGMRDGQRVSPGILAFPDG